MQAVTSAPSTFWPVPPEAAEREAQGSCPCRSRPHQTQALTVPARSKPPAGEGRRGLLDLLSERIPRGWMRAAICQGPTC